MSPRHHAQQFSRFLEYVLGRRPDEFGLIPDAEGYIKVKDLLKALGDDDYFRHIRLAHIQELMWKETDPPVEIQGPLIRAKSRGQIPRVKPCEKLPKLLYGWTRKKAYPHVFQNGLAPSAHPWVVLAKERDVALRLAKRTDLEAVMLTVLVQKCLDNGLIFHEFGELILSGFIPVDGFTGPPLPKEKEESKSRETMPRKSPEPVGSFFMDPEKIMGKQKPQPGRGKHGEPAWKRDRNKIRREKERL